MDPTKQQLIDWIDADRWLLAAGFLIIAEGDSGHLYLDLQTGKVLFMDPEVSGIAFVRGGPELDSICVLSVSER